MTNNVHLKIIDFNINNLHLFTFDTCQSYHNIIEIQKTFTSIIFLLTTFKGHFYLFHHIGFMTFNHHHQPPYALPNFFSIFFTLHLRASLSFLAYIVSCVSLLFMCVFCSNSFIVYFWDLTCIYVMGMMLWLNCERLLDVTFVALWNKISGNPIK